MKNLFNNNLKKRIFTSFALIFLIFLIFYFYSILIYSLIIITVISIIEFLSISKKIIKSRLNLYLINIFFIIYVSTFSFMFFFFSTFPHLKIILYILLVGCIASDIGGYVFGKLLKGPKLTKISPNKTFSGAFGSLLLTCFAVSFLIYSLTENISYSIIIVGFITSLFCQLGDLFFSLIKRKAKVKDTGNILPGHGGILDRIDGILVGIPFGFIALTLLYQ